MLFGLATVTELAVTIYVNKNAKCNWHWNRNKQHRAARKRKTLQKTQKNVKRAGEKKKILITGSGSYVGTSVEAWLRQWYRSTTRLKRWI